jgi:hypothetical protein
MLKQVVPLVTIVLSLKRWIGSTCRREHENVARSDRSRDVCVFFSESVQMNWKGAREHALRVCEVPPHLERHTRVHLNYTHLAVAFHLFQLPKCIHHCHSHDITTGKNWYRPLVTWRMRF